MAVTTIFVLLLLQRLSIVPTWGVVGILLLIVVVTIGIAVLCLRRWWNKRRRKGDKKGFKGAVDLKGVSIITCIP